ncbi:hypothetical protein J4450_00915 [Candidatus Micrarchaeota archaeon]|nr:hypothetical protein [Candidatus Micrarchaeota archaeon]
MKNDDLVYVGLFIGVVLLVWTINSTIQTSITNKKLEKSEANFQLYQQQALSAGSECGDTNDLKNIQHLSHHPDRYKECYKYIDPQKFKDAVGEDISNYLN